MACASPVPYLCRVMTPNNLHSSMRRWLALVDPQEPVQPKEEWGHGSSMPLPFVRCFARLLPMQASPEKGLDIVASWTLACLVDCDLIKLCVACRTSPAKQASAAPGF